MHVTLPHRLRLGPCGALQAAGHRGTTRDVRSPTANVSVWLAPVVVGSLEWALNPAVSIELEGGALFPLRRTRFFLAPNSTIFQVPAASGTVSLGVRGTIFLVIKSRSRGDVPRDGRFNLAPRGGKAAFPCLEVRFNAQRGQRELAL